MRGKYDDIIHLPHHVSGKHPRMSAMDRAAQFSPFSALTGLDARIRETARLTDEQVELDDYAKELLNRKLQLLQENLKSRPTATITYFKPDERKSGGSYETVTAAVRKIEPEFLLLTDGSRIPIEDIYEIE